jgi:hypothetical protein
MQQASSLQRTQTLPAVAKAGIVAGGYFAAILLALGVVSFYIDQTAGPDREASSGMYAFGDSLVFLAVFGAVSTIPTGLALVFLRQSRRFWIALSIAALVVASTSLAAAAAVLLEQQMPALTSLNAWTPLAVLRIFLSPLLAATFGLAALFAPQPRLRWYLFGAAVAEGVTTAYGFFHWFAPLFFH